MNEEKQTAIAFLEFYRNSNWLHEFKSNEQLWEEFEMGKQVGKNTKCACGDYFNPYKDGGPCWDCGTINPETKTV